MDNFYVKFRKSLVLLVGIYFILPGLLNAQVTYETERKWKWLHPKPNSYHLRWCKMWDKDTWYMASNHGAFLKTSNGGQSWVTTYTGRRYNTPSMDYPSLISAYFFDRNNGIVVGQNSTVVRTTNAGVSFDSIPGLYSDNPSDSWNNINFLNSSTGYLIGSKRMAKTTDGGNSWEITSLPENRYFDIWTPDETLIVVSAYGGKVLRSTNAGSKWDIINTPANTSSEMKKLCFLNKDTGFVCGTLGSVIVTTNGGINWVNVNGSLPTNHYNDLDIKITGGNKEVYLTGNGSYIYKTSDLGVTWDTVGFWGPNQINYGSYQIYYSTCLGGGDSLLTVGFGSMINKRNNISNREQLLDFVKFGAASLMDVDVAGENIWGVGIPTGLHSTGGPMDDQIIYSSNGGDTWIKQTSLTTQRLYSINMLNASSGYITGGNGVIRKTINGGASWDIVITPTTADLCDAQFLDMNTGWVFGNSGIGLKTTDGGANWTTLNTGSNGLIFSVSMVDENTGWICGSSGMVSKTTDGGTTWISQDFLAQPAPFLLSIKMVDVNTGYVGGNINFAKTTNGGENWNIVHLPFPSGGSYTINAVDFIDANRGMLLQLESSLKTTNGGQSWILNLLGTNSGSDYASIPRKLKLVSIDTAYMAGWQGNILKYTESITSIIEWENTVPKKYELYQNYPNPFNPSTTIKFSIPKQSAVTLKVYDVTGSEVAVLLNKLQLNPGTVKYTFDGAGLATGVYFYSLITDGNLVETKKMILVK